LWKLSQDVIDLGDIPAVDKNALNSEQKNLRRAIHRTIAKVTDDVGRRQTFNTAVAAIMELLNSLQKAPQSTPQDQAVLREGIESMVLLLNPIAPHMCHVLWHDLGHNNDIETAPWPLVDEAALIEDEKLIVVQVNGKVRSKITVPADATQEQVQALGLAQENVQQFVEDKTIRKVIYIAGKLLNIVAN
jgi:leucyl-tRNA synthetase